MDLVVGATGLLGTEICRRLRDRRDDVRALVRKTSEALKVERLRSFGCEIVIGDLQDKASLDRACKGIDTVISTATTTMSRQAHDSLEKTDLQGQLNLIDAAERNDVKRFVLISFSGNLEGHSKLHLAKRKVEEKLRESGVSFTILRPSCFMEVWFAPALGFDAKNRKVQIFGAGEEPLSFISLFDVAEFAVRAASSDKAANQTLELGGPEPVAPNEVVKIFEREMGGPFEVTHVSIDALKQQYATATDSYQKAFAGLALDYCVGDEIDMTEALKKFPVKLTTVRDFARKVKSR
ncbi:MAG TPA: SDR family oxidoreductase [Thermoanaerobaculia bacterium]